MGTVTPERVAESPKDSLGGGTVRIRLSARQAGSS